MKEYTEDDLRDAFYKGREQACLPDEKGTKLFIRPTFNGYLRELDGTENPYENWKIRCRSLTNDKDSCEREINLENISEEMKDWIMKKFKDNWETIKTNIDFSKYEPIDITSSLHIIQYTYDIDNKKYHVSYPISDSSAEPIVEILITD
jgi:hypothetical protein